MGATIEVLASRRTERRQPKAGTDVSYRRGSLGLGPEVAARLLDVSEGGAMLIMGEPLLLGEDVEVNITPPGHSRPLVRMGIVARCRPLEEGGFAAGVEFQSYLSYADLFQLT
jgi:hypothetical protein